MHRLYYRKNLLGFNQIRSTLIKTLFACFFIFSTTQYAEAQTNITVIGTVLDSLGNPISGATVSHLVKKGPSVGTDKNGKFLLETQVGASLKVSFVGYVAKELTVSNQREITIILNEEKTQFSEVVITAYNRKQQKEAVVGSVTTVRVDNLKVPASNLTNAMAGQIAGVIAYQPSGQPGADNSNFFIRGVTTFGYKQSPLILIDNVELTASDLARLNVDDIESFSILKDASATALYDARGGNGVILVKTKEGKIGRPQISARLHLILGPDSYNSILEHRKNEQVEMEQWKHLSLSTDLE